MSDSKAKNHEERDDIARSPISVALHFKSNTRPRHPQKKRPQNQAPEERRKKRSSAIGIEIALSCKTSLLE
jgi:hypothetical protein